MSKLNGIPVGHYCYILDKDHKAEGNVIPIKTCPYWQATKKGAYCQYLDLESEKGADSLIWDQVKECGVNLPT